ncbi:Glycosyl transferase family 31 protein [Dioscorea alata]|uniref:Glycosyl transferase family 31 protein n=2 Tax=Dioscorea alata TaxID=55571 RepID=A0ACB7UB71_DIOAL|nr:Glycosyl transferase family 31 protein [Dioscorea alata]KAH7657503.1 Glycosyl transferase family 31 protein [Dioscorea alata]
MFTEITKMPPTSSTFLPYSKDDKAKRHKPFAAVPPPPRISLSLLISGVFFFVGAVGIVFAIVVLLRPPRIVEVSVFRCGRAEDTLRNFRSRSSVGGGAGLEDRPKLLGFVGVQTGFGSADRRTALRRTWFPSDPEALARMEQSTGLAFRFVIGRTKDAKKMAELRREEAKYHDFLFIDAEEEYLKLPQKTLAFFKAAYSLFDAEFYVKADDDIYLRPDRLTILLAKDRAHRRTYIGCMKKGPVVTDPKMKWYESSGHLIGNEYFLHAYGPIYALSAEVVGALAATKNDSLRMFSNEDVTIGSWMLSMDVNHEDNRALCDPKCTSTSIAVWDIPKCSGLCNPAEKMKELHKTGMCSKSPTLPPDDDR